MKTALVLLMIFFHASCFSQKTPLDLAAIEKWPKIYGEKISANGKWVMYTVHCRQGPDSLVVVAANKQWQLKLAPPTDVAMSPGSHFLVYQKDQQLSIYDISKQQWQPIIPRVKSFKLPAAGNDEWLAFHDLSNKLILCNIHNQEQNTFDAVNNYWFSHNGNALVIQTATKNDRSLLKWIDLKTHITTNITTCKNFHSLVFNASGTGIAFIADRERGTSITTSIGYYKIAMDSAAYIEVDRYMDNSLVLGSLLKFSANNDRIFFTVKKQDPQKTTVPASGVNIWHYKDDYLPTEKSARSSYVKNRNYTCVLHLEEKKIIQLDEETDEPNPDLSNDDGPFILLKQSVNYFTAKWRPSSIPSYDIKNIKTGERKTITSQKDVTVNMSPSGKYVLWYDPSQQTYFSYQTATAKIRNIAANFPVALQPSYQAQRVQVLNPFGMAAWLNDDNSVLLYDQFDIWKIDLQSNHPPLNITNGYGRKNHIIFRIWNESGNDYAIPLFSSSETLLTAFDTENKNNGFFKLSAFPGKDPVQLCLGPYLYYAHKRFNLQFLQSSSIIKAKGTNTYLLSRSNSHAYPNLYTTSDFKNFNQVTNLHPEQQYNWLTTDLHSWKTPGGKTLQGILYKPSDFDPTKKYPLIFYFYEKLSHRLHQYIDPALSNGTLNIPFYVSNGYLVFTPDMDYIPGHPGDGILNAVVSAAHYLSQLPFVDSSKMGLQGHSFGGYEVNYIISHSNLFAAAQESAGASDFISYYNGFYRESSAQFYFEFGQGRIGATLWEKPELFITNSPIFSAANVQTPLLIMHNKDDGEVPFQQGLEWFTGLKRLDKKVWMLQYDNEHHGIDQKKNQLDFTLRSKQFFDHYLKGEAMPSWMQKEGATLTGTQ